MIGGFWDLLIPWDYSGKDQTSASNSHEDREGQCTVEQQVQMRDTMCELAGGILLLTIPIKWRALIKYDIYTCEKVIRGRQEGAVC